MPPLSDPIRYKRARGARIDGAEAVAPKTLWMSDDGTNGRGAMSLVLIPGFMADASLWDDLLVPLAEFGPILRVQASAEVATIAELTDLVLAQAPVRFAVIGFSMGGYVARQVAYAAPERVRGLALVASSARGDTPAQQRQKDVAVQRLAQTGFGGLSRQAVRGSVHPDRAEDSDLIQRIRRMGEALGGAVFLRQATEMRDSDRDRLGEIGCPTLVVAAAQDRLRGLDEARELAEGIIGARLAVIEGSGHMLPMEAPEDLAAVLVPWLRQIA